MSDHALRFFYDHDVVGVHTICTAPPEANCHLTVTCSCETYSEIIRDDQGAYHLYPDEPGEPREKHYMTPEHGWCNIVEWLDADSALDCGPSDLFDLVDLPIDLTWTGDYYEWSKA